MSHDFLVGLVIGACFGAFFMLMACVHLERNDVSKWDVER